jgi:hypothetical protein
MSLKIPPSPDYADALGLRPPLHRHAATGSCLERRPHPPPLDPDISGLVEIQGSRRPPAWAGGRWVA